MIVLRALVNARLASFADDNVFVYMYTYTVHTISFLRFPFTSSSCNYSRVLYALRIPLVHLCYCFTTFTMLHALLTQLLLMYAIIYNHLNKHSSPSQYKTEFPFALLIISLHSLDIPPSYTTPPYLYANYGRSKRKKQQKLHTTNPNTSFAITKRFDGCAIITHTCFLFFLQCHNLY